MSKKQIIQLLLLTLFLYLGVFFLITGGWEYYDVYFLISLVLLSGLYVIYGQKEYQFVKYLRILFYVTLGFLACQFIIENFIGYTSNYSFYVSQENSPLEVLKMIFNSFPFFYILMVFSVLLFNKPLKKATFKLGKFKVSL